MVDEDEAGHQQRMKAPGSRFPVGWMVASGGVLLLLVVLGAVALGDGLRFSPWLVGFFVALAVAVLVLETVARRFTSAEDENSLDEGRRPR